MTLHKLLYFHESPCAHAQWGTVENLLYKVVHVHKGLKGGNAQDALSSEPHISQGEQ